MVNIPNKANGQVLDAAELFKLIDEDQTGGTISSSTTETLLAEATITANQASEGFLVIATGKTKHNATGANTGTVRLYTGTNVAFASNTLRKTITRLGDDAARADEQGWAMTLFVTADPTDALRFQITGQNSSAGGDDVTTCESLVVIGV